MMPIPILLKPQNTRFLKVQRPAREGHWGKAAQQTLSVLYAVFAGLIQHWQRSLIPGKLV